MRDFIRKMFGGSDEEIDPATIDYENATRRAITVSGRVQGVGFRFFTQNEAMKLRLTGWVKNLNNGDVTMEVQGAPEDVDELVDRLKRGNGYSKVTKMLADELPVDKEERKFVITY